MKLIEECYRMINEPDDALPILEALEESIRQLNLQSKGSIIKPKDAKDFFKTNPKLATDASVLAIGTISQYGNIQKNTIKLHAKSAYERKMITSIVDALKGGGKFRVHRIKFEGGGKTWIMKRK